MPQTIVTKRENSISPVLTLNLPFPSVAVLPEETLGDVGKAPEVYASSPEFEDHKRDTSFLSLLITTGN